MDMMLTATREYDDAKVLPLPMKAGDSSARSGVPAGPDTLSGALLNAMPVAVYTTDEAGRITFYNDAAATLWGCRPELGKSEFCGSWRLYWPDGRPMAHDQCPMAIALKEKRAISGAEAIAERPDGVRVAFLAYPTLLWDNTGALIGAVNSLLEITDRKKNEEAAQRLAAIVESSDDAIISMDLNGIVTTWNAGADHLFRYTAEDVVGKPVTLLIPSDRQDEEVGILERIQRGERIDHYETIRRRKDGLLVEVSLTVSPVKDAHGKIIGASKIARDITERRQAQEAQRLLFREMNHRIKNLFTLASSVVTLSSRFAKGQAELAAAVNERLIALARAHDLILPDITGAERRNNRTTTLATLIRTILAPFITKDHVSITMKGPDVPVSGKAVTSIALLLHEMATNATKYGALVSENGRVEVRWSVSGDELLLTWRERGGPPLNGQPETEGFGSFLARLTVTGQLGGRICHDWEEEGLTARLSAPLERLKT